MTERIDFNALAAQCAQEEARLQFASFSRQDALGARPARGAERRAV